MAVEKLCRFGVTEKTYQELVKEFGDDKIKAVAGYSPNGAYKIEVPLELEKDVMEMITRIGGLIPDIDGLLRKHGVTGYTHSGDRTVA